MASRQKKTFSLMISGFIKYRKFRPTFFLSGKPTIGFQFKEKRQMASTLTQEKTTQNGHVQNGLNAKPVSELALFGGPKAVQNVSDDMFAWPIVTQEDEDAVLEVLRRGAMSGTDITLQFEKEFAAWQGTKYALGYTNGTMALQAAMFACEIGHGDEIISPSLTYWASILPVFSLQGTAVFADINPQTLCIDPDDIERHISPHTKAIMVVHYLGHPCEMDKIMEIAKRHNLKVIEDISHAQGGMFKGKKLGTWGDVGAMSLMSGKSFACGEAGMLVTDNQKIYERAVAWGHYDRFNDSIEDPDLKPFAYLPLGGVKGRVNQTSAAMGRVQLKYYDERCEEIRRAMNYFWDLLEGVPGIRAHRVDENEGSNMAGWYASHGIYVSEELGGLSLSRFCEAVAAEGGGASPGCNFPLHLHPLLLEADVYNQGKPTRNANSDRDLRQPAGSLPHTEAANGRVYNIPWFKKFHKEELEQYAAAYRKVAENYEQLLEGDEHKTVAGKMGLTARS
jgi:dTDP-4-amino-4,6-dideoxygalactose transaminase